MKRSEVEKVNLFRCENGHFYDAERFAYCPHCLIEPNKEGELMDMQRKIEVRGNAEIEVQSDYIEIYINLKATNKNYKKAVASLNEKVETITNCTMDCGLSKESVTSDDYCVYARTHNEKTLRDNFRQVFDEYLAKERLIIGFYKDIELLGKIVDSITQSLSEPDFKVNFVVKDIEKYSQQLLEDMAKDAYNKAKVLCQSAHGQIGKLISVDYKRNDISSFKGENTFLMPALEAKGPEAISSKAIFNPQNINLSESAVFIWEIE